MQVRILSELRVHQHADTEPPWELLYPLYVSVDGVPYTVPAGFFTDFASVPRIPFAYWFAGNTAHRAAVFHDWCYEEAIRSKRWADDVFLEAMRSLDIPWWRRQLMYRAVRMFGKGNYK